MLFSAARAILLTLVFAGCAWAQTGGIAGSVVDQRGEPIAGADITLQLDPDDPAPAATSRADADGAFTMESLAPGLYFLSASKEGFAPAVVHIEVKPGRAARASLRLSRMNPTGRCAATAEAAVRGDYPVVTPLFRWLTLAATHVPGTRDESAQAIPRWPLDRLELVVDLLRQLMQVHREGEELRARDPADWMRRRFRAGQWLDAPPATVRLQGLCFPMTEIEKVFHANLTLKRGAVLHADIAALVGAGQKRRAVYVEDGREQGRSQGSSHWEIGRRLLDAIAPHPADDPDALLWYRAVSAYLLANNLLDEAPEHLARARRIFAKDARFLADSALAHETLASAAVQAAVDELRGGPVGVDVDSRRAELERAERFLRQALALEEDAILRIRLGRVLGALGRHREAAGQLRGVMAGPLDTRWQYFGRLFLGREEQALGRVEDARQQFADAARLYPNAQSPWLAIAGLAREQGDRAGAIRAMEHAMRTVHTAAEADDPRWFYLNPHVDTSPGLMHAMRAIARGASQ